MIVHDMMENTRRIATTTFATGPAEYRRPNIPPVYILILEKPILNHTIKTFFLQRKTPWVAPGGRGVIMRSLWR
jgi:hypothetical protein